jgi:hypothetical protein
VDALLSSARERMPGWEAQAWGAIAVAAAFIAITCWWLTQDHSIPTFDAGFHLVFLEDVYRELGAGHLGKALTLSKPYPPFAYLVGSLGFAIGGESVTSAILTENLVFVSLLAAGCYQIGKRAFGPTAGLLAVVFALGSPLATAQFHVFMIDTPETAMVAGAVWLIIASEAFSRVGVSALAGLTVGLGMLTKEPFVFFVGGVLGVALVRLLIAFVRDGWRMRYTFGLIAFVVPLLAVSLPWYIDQYSVVHAVANGSIHAAEHPTFAGDVAPPRYSGDNITWYFWNFINAQLYLPLFLFAAAGWIWMVIRLARRQAVSALAPELLVGSFVAWLAITDTFVHDTRYSEPMLVFLAVIGTGWLVHLKRPVRLGLIGVLVLVAVANTFATSFGVGTNVSVSLESNSRPTQQQRGLLTIYSNGGFLVSRPRRDGYFLATLRALRRDGVRRVDLSENFLIEPDFSLAGVTALAQIAGLEVVVGVSTNKLSRRDAVFAHTTITGHGPPPCVALDDGTGVWIRLGNPQARGARDFCPTRHPAYYG